MPSFSNQNDEIRNITVQKYNTIIKNIQLSRKIEKSLYNYVIRVSKERRIPRRWSNPIFKNLYNSKIISIYTNLKSDSYVNNTSFLQRILDKEINISNMGQLSVYDINPDNWKDLFDAKEKRDKIKYELKPEAMTNLFKCRKCQSRETSYYEVQTRSAAEPMTHFITCLKCSNRWRQ